MLPNLDDVADWLPHSFFIWMPRDIVGGDIFHVERLDDGIIVAIMDCTGHGVPGAFMTMMACSGLRRIIRMEKCRDPATILRRLNHIVKTSLHQDTEYALSNDGLDAAVCFITSSAADRSKLIFAGAHLPLYYTLNGKIETIRGDRHSIGYKRSDLEYAFSNHTVDVESGMSFYLATDGFTDQLGGEKTKSFGKKRFKSLLLETSLEPFQTQQNLIFDSFNDHMGDHERIDDVTVIGFGFANPEDSENPRWHVSDSRFDLVDRRKGQGRPQRRYRRRRRKAPQIGHENPFGGSHLETRDWFDKFSEDDKKEKLN